MKKLTRQEKHEQCVREIKGTLIVVLLCAVWHVGTAFTLNGKGLYFLGMVQRVCFWHDNYRARGSESFARKSIRRLRV